MLKDYLMGEDEVLALSNGEVTRGETVDYETGSLVPGGQFCPEIFGMKGLQTLSRDYKSLSGDYKYTDRFGHIRLSAPVINPLFYSEAAETLGMREDDFCLVARYRKYVVTNPGDTGLSKNAVIGEKDVKSLLEAGRKFKYGIGAGIIKEMLEKTGNPADKNMVITCLPVLPPCVRPMYKVEGTGKYAVSDKNDLYRSVITRNQRLAKLKVLGAPEFILRCEAEQLQEKIDALFANGLYSRPAVGSSGMPLVSIADGLEKRKNTPEDADTLLLGLCIDFGKDAA